MALSLSIWRLFPEWLSAIINGTTPPIEPENPEPPPIAEHPSRLKVTDEWLAGLEKVLNTRLNKAQREAVRLIAMECHWQEITDVGQIAYILATAYHECRFKSIPERLAKVGTDVRRMQDRYWPSGFYGRGFCQLTWEYNYRKFSPIFGHDLVKNPDAVLLPEVGAWILVRGMRDGKFSGKKLSDYFKVGKAPDWIRARRIVNGDFQADKVRDAAIKILPLLG